jgi:hypothetical protein
MEDKLKPWGDITVVTGKYTKDGVEKNRYQKIGTLFATPHFSRISIKLDALPMGDGWLSVFKRDSAKDSFQDAVDDLGGEPFEQEGIPF